MTDANLSLPQIEERILVFVQEELLTPEESLDRDDDLLSGEILDSVAVLRLSAFVQEEFRFRLEPSDFVVENFQNVAVLARYIEQVTSAGEGSSGNPGS